MWLCRPTPRAQKDCSTAAAASIQSACRLTLTFLPVSASRLLSCLCLVVRCSLLSRPILLLLLPHWYGCSLGAAIAGSIRNLT